MESNMDIKRGNNDDVRLPSNEDMGTKNHDCSVPAIHSNNVQAMSMEIGKVGISDNGLKDITKLDRFDLKLEALTYFCFVYKYIFFGSFFWFLFFVS